ncbi:MAG: type VI secretion system baseplate subunit TssK [Desulfobacterales bacterium]|nr:type VI secretion system baseplate subunit TssK [Desulfobacterales bacterium]
MKKPLFWHQGLFLQPQHFQQEDIYFQSLLTPFYQFIQPHFWGIKNLEIPTISGNTFDKPTGEFLFQDMTYIVCPGNALVEARPIDESWMEEGKSVTVYIGLKKFDSAGKNVTVLSKLENLSEVSTRFATTADHDEVQDLHQGDGPPANMKNLFHVLKIFFEPEKQKLGDYSLIPIAELKKDADTIIFSETYAPPCIDISGADSLMKIVTEIKKMIASRANQLESYKREKGFHTSEFGARDMVFLLALRSLNRYVPLLFHMTEVQPIHPCNVYALLRQLAGELSSFSDEVNVLGEEDETRLIFNYDHQNLWKCFSSAQELITRLLDDITAGPDYIIPLVYDGAYFAAELEPKIFEGGNRFYLVFKTEAESESIIQHVESIVKMSSRESLPILIARALGGVSVRHLQTPPQELPRRAHSIYFEIDNHSDQWGNVERGRNIALYWDTAPDDLSVELMVVGRT